jgi:signal transduction histidine kinase
VGATTLIALLGWTASAALALAALRLRRRLELVAQAAHELRGPVAAIAFAVAWLRREPGGVRRALRFEAELERMRLGLADLDAARQGRRAPAQPRTVPLERLVKGAAAGWRPSAASAGRGLSVSWDAGRALVRVDRARLSQALSNLLANAVEHGSGPIEVRAVRNGERAVRIEVRDGGPAVRRGRRAVSADRGHGLGVAARAVREAGGTLSLEREPEATTAAVELPLVEGGER